MQTALEFYIEKVKEKGGIDTGLINPFVNLALDFADSLLHKAQTEGVASVGDVEIEVSEQWQLLSVAGESASYNDFIKGLEKVIEQAYIKNI